MTASYSPPFGQADLSNCERELIHLAGSIQPHGILLVVSEPDGLIVQASAQAAQRLGLASSPLGQPLACLGEELAAALAQRSATLDHQPVALRAELTQGPIPETWEGSMHRIGERLVILELEPVGRDEVYTVDHEQERLLALVAQAVHRFGNAASQGVLADAAAQSIRDLIGHDRVMIYKFDADGHGKIIAEARDPRLDSLLGHHYPATDIPQRARALYLSNRVRVLVDVHYEASPLVGLPGTPDAQELDMSMCYLRSMSPLHLQYLKNMGVTATLVASLVREGRLWGLIAAHHYSPRNVRQSVRAACDLLAEVISTRIAAIENYAHAQVAVLVRRLEQRLVEATSTEGDWRLALLRNPRTLLQPLEATGAALFTDDEVMTSGEVPSTPELRELRRWVDRQSPDALFSCSSVAKANPELASLTPVASGVLAVRLSNARPDYLMWFRKEQLQTVTWAGDPSKPMVGNDPLELSPRRSFAAWSEIVRGTALPWTSAELALGRAFGHALVDIIMQVHGVRLLIAEHQLASIRATVQSSAEAVLIADAQGHVLFCNDALAALTGGRCREATRMQDLARLFTEPERMHAALDKLRGGQPPWRGELALGDEGETCWPVQVRAEAVSDREGRVLGFILTLFDLRDSKRAAAARRHLEESMQRAAGPRGATAGTALGARTSDDVINAILTNASLAAMDISDASVGTPVATLLEELEASTQRAAQLYEQVRHLSRPTPADER